MQSLIKIPLLFIFLCISIFGFDFPQPNPYSAFKNSNFFSGMEKVKAELISDRFIKSGNDIYKINAVYYFFIDSFNKHEGFYYNGYFYFVDSPLKKAYCFWADTSLGSYTRNCYVSHPPPAVEVEYRNSVEFTVAKIATCQADENFNTDTQQCQKCPDGQSWNPATNSCFNDCSKDGKINKVGLPDGRCIDCSGEKDSFAVLKCLCSGFGLSGGNTFWSKYGSSPSDCNLEGSCSDGSQISFINPKCSVKPDPKPDDNKTKPDDPNPHPDDNKTKPDDPNNPNQGGGNQGGNQGGNNGGNQGNNTNPNPDPKPNPKPGNGNSTNNDDNNNGGGGNKDTEAKFNPGDFDYSDKKREYDDFKNKYSKALDDVLKGFDGFKQGVDQFISNVQGKGLASADKHNKPTTCVKKYEIDFFGYKTSIEFDFCKVAATVSGAFYYIFYAFFFYCFLILIVKILLFAF